VTTTTAASQDNHSPLAHLFGGIPGLRVVD
jgi:hypothetical protein